jgi:hypothetical protein
MIAGFLTLAPRLTLIIGSQWKRENEKFMSSERQREKPGDTYKNSQTCETIYKCRDRRKGQS